MKKIILTVVATAAMAAAIPAVAQPYGGGYDRDRDGRPDRYERDGGYDRDGRWGRDDRYNRYDRYERIASERIDQRQAMLRQRIDVQQQRGRLTGYEARDLRRKLQDTEYLERQYKMRGRDFTQNERAVIQRKLDIVADQIRQQSRDSERAVYSWRW